MFTETVANANAQCMAHCTKYEIKRAIVCNGNEKKCLLQFINNRSIQSRLSAEMCNFPTSLNMNKKNKQNRNLSVGKQLSECLKLH